MKRIKLSLGFSLLFLTGAGMLATDLVVLPFWVGDILARESRHLQQRLAGVAHSGNAEAVRRELRAVLDAWPDGCVTWEGGSHVLRHGDTACLDDLQPLIAAARTTASVHTANTHSSLTALLAPARLTVAVPQVGGNRSTAVAGAAVPVARLLDPLWHKQKIIAAYLAFNALVLAALAFFRLLKSYVQPVDRMVREAENYRGDGMHAFLAERPANELGQLAGSIQAMVERIEADRAKLTATVEELAQKNTLLRDNQREMVRAEKLATVGRLAAGLAHEIGNPLGVAQGYLQLLAMEDCREAERLEYTAKALRELERVDGLIRGLLDYARSGRGEPARVRLHPLLAETVASLEGLPLLKGIRLDLAPLEQSSEIWVDPEQLRQVILNCVLNAADAIKACRQPGEGAIVIAEETAQGQDQPGAARPLAALAIADNGGGIPPELLETVFDPFFTTKEPGAGTGLGLSVSQALIEAMGGRIALHSTVGAGTTVHILLPLADAEPTDSDQQPRQAVSPATPGTA